MENSKGILIEVDILTNFLITKENESSILRNYLSKYICYTTFIQASELLSVSANQTELKQLEKGLIGLKVLGASSRYSHKIAEQLYRIRKQKSVTNEFRFAITSAIANESNLPIFTLNKNFIEVYSSLGNDIYVI